MFIVALAICLAHRLQPQHCLDDLLYMEDRIGKERMQRAYAYHSLLSRGAKLALGSDWTVRNVIMYHALSKEINKLLICFIFPGSSSRSVGRCSGCCQTEASVVQARIQFKGST